MFGPDGFCSEIISFGEKHDGPGTRVCNSVISKLSGRSGQPQGVDEERENRPRAGCSPCSRGTVVPEAPGGKQGAAGEALLLWSGSGGALGCEQVESRAGIRAWPPGVLSFPGSAGGGLGRAWPPWAPDPSSAEGAGPGCGWCPRVPSVRERWSWILHLYSSLI